MTEQKLKDAASVTPDPSRALKNLSSFMEENPSFIDRLAIHLREISLLFSSSQFLSNYCIAHPGVLFDTLSRLDVSLDREHLSEALLHATSLSGTSAEQELQNAHSPQTILHQQMRTIREFRMQEILRITLRDFLKKADLVEVMHELSFLADVIIENSLRMVTSYMHETYGTPSQEAFSVISLGKLGGEELNFSSDVDLIFVYGTEIGETTGVSTPQGIRVSRISNHEYYCKLGEELTGFLSANTDSGFAYRVDLRLRPEGQRGDLALALRGYEMYYESWGRAWERAMLIRARPVAGDQKLGSDFMEMIRPFVYRKYLDFSAIDEIKRLKTRIDSTFKKGDIKRGYGGIREIEFFAQALQLIYGGKEPLLRERSLLKTLHRLLQKSLIGQEDYALLSDNYHFLRTLEHRLQQLNDIQTHTVPSGDAELDSLSKKMGFREKKAFLENLEKRRQQVRNIYDSLFVLQEEEPSVAITFFNEEFSDAELREYLAEKGLENIEGAVRNIKFIKDSTFSFQTLKGRRLLSEILPAFLDSALKSSVPDRSLNNLQSFAALLSSNESYLEIFRKNRELIDLFTYVFSQSSYLSKMLMTRPQYLEMIGWQRMVKKSLSQLIHEIKAGVSEGQTANDAIRLIKQTEEIRLGLLFVQKNIPVTEVIRGLSKTAEAILSVCNDSAASDIQGLAIIGLGKLGGREITFNSDLDIVFVCPETVQDADTKAAEKFLRMLISYTKEGMAYRVDTRLRPEGSKGPLVSSLESFTKYYEKAAAFWEFQALLKARPVAGSIRTGMAFINMAKEALIQRGHEVSPTDIRQMRERILRDLSKEADGYDIKLGPGGIEEIEFMIQYLQLKNCRKHNKLLVQGTLNAIQRLKQSGIVTAADAATLRQNYIFFRTLESFLRLSGEKTLKHEGNVIKNAAAFMGFEDKPACRTGRDEFVEHLVAARESSARLSEKYFTLF